MTPQISIITPSLNQGAYLPHALASVAAQSDISVEHLVFDAGSMDGSRATLRAWAGGSTQRRIFLEKDVGVADAIAKGVSRANSDILGWLCADDAYVDDALARVHAAFVAHPECDVVYGRSMPIDAMGHIIGVGPFQRDVSKIAETLRAGAPFAQPAAFVRRVLLDKIGPPDPTFGLAWDFEFWMRAARAGVTFRALDAMLARKREHAGSATRLLPGVHAMDCARATRAHFGAASPAWIARAIKADVPQGGGTAAIAAATVQRRLDRARASDLLVVLGNGPSLIGFDFEQLRGVDAIGMNAAYRHWHEIGWYPRYYACLDTVVGVSHCDGIEAMVLEANRLGIDSFLLRNNLIGRFGAVARRSQRVINFDELAAIGLLDIAPVTTGSHSALYGALLGYRRMGLLGVDCNYVERVEGARLRKGTELELVSMPGHNPNYFFEGYQRTGDRFNIPNPVPDLHIDCWRAVGARLAARGVEVWNASRASRVDAFAYRPFSRLVRTPLNGQDATC